MFHGAKYGVRVSAVCRTQLAMSTQAGTDFRDSDSRSVHSDGVQEVHNVPLRVIIRPIPPELDEHKVRSLMSTIQVKTNKYT